MHENRRIKVLAALEDEAAGSTANRLELAQKSLDYLSGSRMGSLELLGVDRAITRCAEDDNPFLREISALALSFWQGTPAEDQKMNAVLARLDRDDGHGEEILTRYRDEEKQANAPVTKTPGLTVSFNATVALARRGSDKVRPGVLKKMLDQSYLMNNLLIRSRHGKEAPDVSLVAKTMEAALQAVAELHRRRPDRDLSELYPSLDEAAHSSNTALRVEAERTMHALERK